MTSLTVSFWSPLLCSVKMHQMLIITQHHFSRLTPEWPVSPLYLHSFTCLSDAADVDYNMYAQACVACLSHRCSCCCYTDPADVDCNMYTHACMSCLFHHCSCLCPTDPADLADVDYNMYAQACSACLLIIAFAGATQIQQMLIITRMPMLALPACLIIALACAPQIQWI